MSDDADLRDALWKLYQEHSTHMRHYETQRATVAASLLAIASALLGLVTFDRAIGTGDWPLTVLLTVLGAFGALFSLKQYERASLHTERARHYRDALDAMLDRKSLKLLYGKPLQRIKQEADEEHHKNFPHLERLRLNKFWAGLYAAVAVLGLALTVIATLYPQNLM